MTDDLPVDIDTDSSSNDDGGTALWKWAAGAGGVVVGVYLLKWLFDLVFGLLGFLFYYGLIALLVYGAYRGVKYMLSDNSSTSTADEDVALPENIDVEAELEGADSGVEAELGSDLESELGGDIESELGGDIESELQGIEADVETADVETDRDEELEKKFEQLEQEMND